MNANIITDVLPFDYELVDLEHDRKVALLTGSTSGFPVFHARPISEVDLDLSDPETETVAHSDVATRDLPSYHEVLWGGRGSNIVLATGSSSGFPRFCAGLKSGIGLGGVLDELATLTASVVIKRTVADLNKRAAVSIAQTGDTLVVRADNKAAGNTLRAYAGLIRAQAFKLSGIYYVGYDISITNRRSGARKPRWSSVRTPNVEVMSPGGVDGSSSFRE